MNVISKFNEEKAYVRLLKHHDNIEKIYHQMKEDSANAICDHIESIVKKDKYKEKILDGFRRSEYSAFYEFGILSILVQALNKNNERLCGDYDGSLDEEYQPVNTEVLDFGDRINHYIREVWKDGIYEFGTDEMYSLYIDLEIGSSRKKYYYKTGIRVITEDNEHIDGDNYEYVYYVNKSFKRGIIAYYNFIKRNIEEIKEILYSHLDNGLIEVSTPYSR